MGGSESKPPPEPLFERPWRVINWEARDELLKYVRNYKPEGASHVRIMVLGPVGVGKSSFINTVGALITGRNVNVAAANVPNSTESFTVQFKTHQFKFKDGEKRTVPIVFNDVIGLEAREDREVKLEDIKLAMEGHMKDGYVFSFSHTLSKDNPHYNPSPTVDDQVHVLVCMLDANATDINPSVLEKMRDVRITARDLEIPQVAVVTHIDSICEETDQDITRVYRSKVIKKKMDLFSANVGIPINNIYAVRNHYEGAQRDAADTLILTALKDMLDFGDDCIDINKTVST